MVPQASRIQLGFSEQLCGVVQLQHDMEQDVNDIAPSYSSLQFSIGPLQMALLLLDHGADANAGDNGSDSKAYQESEGELLWYLYHCTSLT